MVYFIADHLNYIYTLRLWVRERCPDAKIKEIYGEYESLSEIDEAIEKCLIQYEICDKEIRSQKKRKYVKQISGIDELKLKFNIHVAEIEATRQIAINHMLAIQKDLSSQIDSTKEIIRNNHF
jgi:uncharacterized protein YlxP (DUF503 family)